MLVLVEFEDYIRFCRVGVEAAVAFGVVVLEHHHGVFALGHRKVFGAAVQSESICGGTMYGSAVAGFLVDRVDMDRYE